MKKLLYILFLGFHSFYSFCQEINKEDKQAFFKISTPFVNEKPSILKIGKGAIIGYWYALLEEGKMSPIDTLTLFEMIDNNKYDTTYWNENEINNCYLVRKIPISIENVRKKLTLVNDTAIVHYVEAINNSKNCGYGDFSNAVYSISRPVFNKSKNFALIQYDLINCNNEGKFDTKLFKLENRIWKEIGIVYGLRRIQGCFNVQSLSK
jgi:hypothetical protein